MHMSSAFREDLDSAMSFPALLFILSVPWRFHSCSSRALRLDPPCLPFRPWVLSSSRHLCACFILSSQTTFIMSLGYIPCITAGPISQTGSRAQEAGWQAGPDSALVVGQADFLTLQGTVWSRVVGWRPQGPESSWRRQSQWWQRHWQ